MISLFSGCNIISGKDTLEGQGYEIIEYNKSVIDDRYNTIKCYSFINNGNNCIICRCGTYGLTMECE